MKRVAIITSHPIQYNAPLFKLLAERRKLIIKVFYTWEQSKTNKMYDPGFAIMRSWDIPLLEGYEYEFLKNTSKRPGSDHFFGINNPEIIKSIKGWVPDALLVYGWSFYSHLKLLFYFKGKIKIYFRGDSNLLIEKKYNRAKIILRRLILKWIYRFIDIALYVGINNKKYYLKCGVKEQNLFFAPHSIDSQRFSNSMKFNYRKNLDILDNEIVILFAGKFEPVKNPKLLISAFQALNNKNSKLLLVGNGILEEEILDSIKNNKNIIWLPFQNQSNMPDLYKCANVFVLPSFSETWGLAINEAMTCGLAILASDTCGGAIDLIQNGKNGFIFKNNDLPDLKNKLEITLQNFMQFGNNSKKIITKWSIKETALSIENAINL